MKTLQKGAVKFKSIKAAAEAAKIPYITFYQRLRAGVAPSKAFHGKVRKYTKKAAKVATVETQDRFEMHSAGALQDGKVVWADGGEA